MADRQQSLTYRRTAQGILAVLQWALALTPAAVYVTVGFEWAVMVGFFLTVAFGFEIMKRQVKSEVQ